MERRKGRFKGQAKGEFPVPMARISMSQPGRARYNFERKERDRREKKVTKKTLPWGGGVGWWVGGGFGGAQSRILLSTELLDKKLEGRVELFGVSIMGRLACGVEGKFDNKL